MLIWNYVSFLLISIITCLNGVSMTDEELIHAESLAVRELMDEYERVTGKYAQDDVLLICTQAAHLAIHAPFEWSATGDLYFYGKKFEAIFV